MNATEMLIMLIYFALSLGLLLIGYYFYLKRGKTTITMSSATNLRKGDKIQICDSTGDNGWYKVTGVKDNRTLTVKQCKEKT